jgi:glycopeptide antibiotics resistance protein
MDLPIEAFALFIWGPGLILAWILNWRRGRRFSYLFCLTVFWVYLLFVLDGTLFPIPVEVGKGGMLRAQGITQFSRMNLNPLFFGPFATPESILYQAVHNILLTIPFGFGMNFLKPVRWKRLPGLVLAGGLGIEAIQLLVGWLVDNPYRVIDINDALMNALGVIIGYLAFRLFAWLYITLVAYFRVNPKGFFGFVDAVARGRDLA